MPILDDTEIRELHQAALSAGLVRSRGALMAGIDGGFVAGLAGAESPAAQLLVDLDALSNAEALADGTVPLRTWLANAAVLASARREAVIFARFRDRVSAVRPAHEPPRVTEPPTAMVTEDRLLDALCAILPSQLDMLVFKLAVPAAFLSGATAAQATRAVEILRWAAQQGRTADVIRLLQEVTGQGSHRASR